LPAATWSKSSSVKVTGTALWARNVHVFALDGTTSSVGYNSTPGRLGMSLSLRR
jgi:hypothetical protein